MINNTLPNILKCMLVTGLKEPQLIKTSGTLLVFSSILTDNDEFISSIPLKARSLVNNLIRCYRMKVTRLI